MNVIHSRLTLFATLSPREVFRSMPPLLPSSVATSGAIDGALEGLAKNGHLATTDTANGKMWEQRLFDFTKSGVSSLFSFGIAQQGDFAREGLKTALGIDGVIAGTILGGTQDFATNAVTGAICA
jgi:hypothetical protein